MTDGTNHLTEGNQDNDGAMTEFSSSLQASGATMTAEQRRRMRQQKRQSADGKRNDASKSGAFSDERFAKLLAKNEDNLLEFVAKVNKVYEQKLKKDAPFMTFVLCGMQSAGKSTIMERFMNAVLNIIQEGTGTRCPLDTTCIHDESCHTPKCDLFGDELEGGGENLTVDQVFALIVSHNKNLAFQDCFSTKPLRLVFRSKDVQNMRFVDTPGIISNKSTGKDNREDIMEIIRSELRRPNTKLCVLLEATEYAKNPIIEFLDSSLNGRDKWINNATFLMTKFDKQTNDSRTASKANGFFREFHDNQCFPHLVITPTLPKEDLPPAQLFQERQNLLSNAASYERNAFSDWLDQQELYRQQLGEKDMLDERVSSRLGFNKAKKVMREIMLKDTAERLPEVIEALRKELDLREKEQRRLIDMQKFNDPRELKSVVAVMLGEVDDRLDRYLDGDLESSMKFPERMQTLEEEIEDEENSEWSEKELNFHTDRENFWRDRIARFEGEYPDEIRPNTKFLGGKQFHRAIEFFRVVMVDSLPDPFELEALVPNVTGYLGGGIQRENWERATVEIVRVLLKDVSHPGINYLVKHVGNIFRRLFRIAMDDIKHGEQFSSTFKLMPRGVEKELNEHFDAVLWKLMKNASEKTHMSLEPMYSTVDPTLPTLLLQKNFDISKKDDDDDSMKGVVARLTQKWAALTTGSGSEAKAYLKEESRERARSKQSFLPNERTSMITKEETFNILRRSFAYIVGLLELNLINLRFMLNHYLFLEFKKAKRDFVYDLMSNADWHRLVEKDDDIDDRLEEVKDQITSLKESLDEVKRMNSHF